jgi:hypothetical protein
MKMRESPLELEAKGLTAIAFRNGPIEDIHSKGKISQSEMKHIMKHAVNWLWYLLSLKETNPILYLAMVCMNAQIYASQWDEPVVSKRCGKRLMLLKIY